MNTATPVAAARPAQTLNAACQCIWLDRDRLRSQLQHELGAPGQLLESRPGLASGSVVFVDAQDAAAMERTCRLLDRALSSPTFHDCVAEHAPAIARRRRDGSAPMLGIDFHLGGPVPQLIEINTNPGGLLVNLELARATTACCDCLTEPLDRMVAGDVPLAELSARIADAFRAEWAGARGDGTLTTIAIVDDTPTEQYLYPEFLLYQGLFERNGWRTQIVDASRLEVHGDALTADGRRVDLVYNRVTDFYLAQDRHSALRRACESDLAVVAPDPAAHAHWADKRLLAWLRDDALLRAAGLEAAEREHLRLTIPATEIVTPGAADDLWRRRKDLFFKPVDGYGSKAAYRGGKLTRATFDHVLSHHYVAQAIAPTSGRKVVAGGEATELRVDVRNYSHRGTTWLRAARLYRGQTTNFRTPGGGFAPVLTLPA